MKGSRSSRPPSGGSKIREIDLHLRPGQSGAEALERQLARVRGELNSSIRAGAREIIFIHGFGSGRLREALRTLIAAEYPSCTCHDASFARYGYNGATVVTITK
jgi:dsDNA-specific endonuclease/ATPase MutS2